jgi:hypothetical protein
MDKAASSRGYTSALAAHLTLSVDRLQQRARRGVPRLDAAVVGAAAAGEQVPLMRTPRQRLDGSAVVSERQPRRVVGGRLPVQPDAAAARRRGVCEQ